MSMLDPISTPDSQGVEVADYKMLFDPGMFDIEGKGFSMLTRIVFGFVKFCGVLTSWVADRLANPESMLNGLSDVYKKATAPIFDILPIPVLMVTVMMFVIATSFMRRTESLQASLQAEGKRIVIVILAGLAICVLFPNPFVLTSGVATWVASLLREMFSSIGSGSTPVTDLFLRPLTQTINFGQSLTGACDRAWSAAILDDADTFACTANGVKSSISDPGADQLIASIVGFLVVVVMLAFQVACLIAFYWHYINGLVGTTAVGYAAAVSLARRHNFDLLGRAAGYLGAHLVLMVVVLMFNIMGPGITFALADRVNSGSSSSMILSLFLMGLFNGLLLWMLFKLVSSTGKLSQFFRIGTNKKMQEHYATPGTSMLEKMGFGSAMPTVPEAVNSGKLGFLASLGMPGTGAIQQALDKHNGKDGGMAGGGSRSSAEAQENQDAAIEASGPVYAPTPTAGVDSTGEPVVFETSDGEPVEGYDSDRQVFDENGAPITGWTEDAEGNVSPTTFDKDGEPLAPVSDDGTVNDIFDRDGNPIWVFPTSRGASTGSFLTPGQEAPVREAVEPANNPYGDSPVTGEQAAANDSGYFEDPDTVTRTFGAQEGPEATEPAATEGENQDATVFADGVQSTGRHAAVEEPEPAGTPAGGQGQDDTEQTEQPVQTTATVFSDVDTTGAGMHGSTMTPVPPVRYTPPMSTPPAARQEIPGSEHPGFDAYLPDVGDQMVFDGMPAPATPRDPDTANTEVFGAGQVDVPLVHIERAASLRDPLAGYREAAGREADRLVDVFSGGSGVQHLDPDDAQFELELFTANGVTQLRHVHQLALDGALD